MPIWLPASVDGLSLMHWRVMRTEQEERHLLGVRHDTMVARVSSALRDFDANLMIGVTSTGRQYRLVGLPGWTQDTRYLWVRWCQKYEVRYFSDVTGEYLRPSAVGGDITPGLDLNREGR